MNLHQSEVLKHALTRLMRRLNWLRMEFCLTRSYVVGLLLAVAVLALHKTYLISSSVWAPVAIVVVTGLVGLEWWRRRRANLFETAIEADRQLGLKEKLSSGVAFTDPSLVRRKAQRTLTFSVERELPPALRRLAALGASALRSLAVILPPINVTPAWARREAKSELVPALVAEAAATAGRTQPRRVFPWRANWRLYSIGAMELLMLIGLLAWSGKDLRSAEQRAVGKALEVEGKKLEEVAKQQKEIAEREKMPEAKKAALELAKLGKQMQDKRMPKKDAMLKLDELQRQTEKMQEKAAQQKEAKEVTSLQKLADALKEEQLQNEQSQELAKQLVQQNMAEARSAVEKMMKQLQDKKTSAEKKKELAKELEQMAKALEKAGASDLAKQMQQLAQSMQSGNQQQMQQAGQQLQQMMSNLQMSQEQMEALSQMGQMMKMSQMNIGQSDQKCELCDGSGKG